MLNIDVLRSSIFITHIHIQEKTMSELVQSLPNFLGLTKWWNRFCEAMQKHRTYRETVRELNRLSDRELADLGIHRSMIKSIAMEGHYDNQTR
jgi:uncharacterized protein YjiS (DUF1127 family)